MAISYQWRKDGVDIPGATDATYTTPSLNVSDDGSIYKCVVTDTVSNISVTSDGAALTVNATGDSPVITDQPDSVSVNQDSSASFGIAVETSGVAVIANHLFRMNSLFKSGIYTPAP